jgi:hypothetical protein
MAATNTIASPSQTPPAKGGLPDEPAVVVLQTRPEPHYLFYCYTCGPEEQSRNVRQEIGGELHPHIRGPCGGRESGLRCRPGSQFKGSG